MVCRYYEKIIFLEFIKQYAKIFVKLFYLFCIADRISPMTPKCIKVNKIYKTKTCKISFCYLYGLLHTVNTWFWTIALGDALSCKYVIYLTHWDNIKPCILKRVKNSASCRL